MFYLSTKLSFFWSLYYLILLYIVVLTAAFSGTLSTVESVTEEDRYRRNKKYVCDCETDRLVLHDHCVGSEHVSNRWWLDLLRRSEIFMINSDLNSSYQVSSVTSHKHSHSYVLLSSLPMNSLREIIDEAQYLSRHERLIELIHWPTQLNKWILSGWDVEKSQMWGRSRVSNCGFLFIMFGLTTPKPQLLGFKFRSLSGSQISPVLPLFLFRFSRFIHFVYNKLVPSVNKGVCMLPVLLE